MKEKRTLLIYEEQTFLVGQNTFIDSVAENNNTVVFEDDGTTGYFYAVNRNKDLTILDSLHIYNVADIIDKNKPSIIKILWTEDLLKAFLSINNYYHAVFDFEARAGYCRNGVPNSKSGWTIVKERVLTDELLDKLAKD
ncbi:MAG: DUF2251 domain-containing protein [Chitinophagaceae bacterium]|nr:DUF2251 domain-containing protein [Chitinophagaceae bacterium]